MARFNADLLDTTKQRLGAVQVDCAVIPAPPHGTPAFEGCIVQADCPLAREAYLRFHLDGADHDIAILINPTSKRFKKRADR